MTEKPIVIRDRRNRKFFRIEDKFIDKYARFCGVNASLVYMAICRHSDSNQECYPSVKLLMEEIGVRSNNTVLKAIKVLESFGIISVRRERDKTTKRQMVNVYTIMDESTWNPSAPSAPGAECISEADPSAFDAQKPSAPSALEGNTKRRKHIEGCVAQSAPPTLCTKEGCKEKSMKGVELCEKHQPMTCLQFISWYRRSTQRHIKIIAEWADELCQQGHAPNLRTVAQWRAWAKPIMKAAEALSIYDDDQIGSAMKRMMAATYITEYNLHTVNRFMANTSR